MAYETSVIKLPSNGKFGNIPSEITIRNLTGADEKIIYSGMTENAIDRLLKNCILEPKDIVTADLCEQDKYYILVQLRVLTFGSGYSFQAVCPECGKKMNVEVDLDSLNVNYADDDIIDKLKCTLPCGDEVTFKILTSKDINEVNTTLAKLKKTNDRGTQIILRQASIIDTINGEKSSLSERQAYIEQASSRDLNYIWKQYAKINLGIDMTTLVDCPNCGQVVEVPIVMNAEFFRPTSDD